jgi:uncharacterized membrane protein
MFHMPPIPTWDGLHPLIIHFPIGLLLVAPVLVLIGILMPPKKGRTMLLAAFVLMLLGTISVFIALETGEAAAEIADRTPEINAIIQQHESLAEKTRLTFSILTVAFAAILFVPTLLKREVDRMAHVIYPLVFLCFYLAGAVMLANTAHQGGRLVHEFGVKALVAPTPGGTPTPAAKPEEGD